MCLRGRDPQSCRRCSCSLGQLKKPEAARQEFTKQSDIDGPGAQISAALFLLPRAVVGQLIALSPWLCQMDSHHGKREKRGKRCRPTAGVSPCQWVMTFVASARSESMIAFWADARSTACAAALRAVKPLSKPGNSQKVPQGTARTARSRRLSQLAPSCW